MEIILPEGHIIPPEGCIIPPAGRLRPIGWTIPIVLGSRTGLQPQLLCLPFTKHYRHTYIIMRHINRTEIQYAGVDIESNMPPLQYCLP